MAVTWASSPVGAPSALIPSIWLCTDGMTVPVTNFVCTDFGGGPFGYFFLVNGCWATLLICWLPLLQIALPFFRNSALVRAAVVDVLLLLLLPHPAATR